ncbi:hypothetical protein MMA231_02457 [Asticcacaulis sp. MM231]|uniref:hypothetical protein n=1 Tax=Asticcacaulis sp. MM231 TaxID=3157666 RepID=UPI0032D59B33
MRNAPNIEKARKEAARRDFMTMSDEDMLNYYVKRKDQNTQLERKFVGELARPHLVKRMEGAPVSPNYRRDSSVGVLERCKHAEARGTLLSESLTPEGLMDLLDQSYDFAFGTPVDDKWLVVWEICKARIYRRLKEGGAHRYSAEYSIARAIDYLLAKQFQTDIKTLNNYIWEPVFYHERGIMRLSTKTALDMKARILCGRTVIAACDLEAEANFRKRKDMEPSSQGGSWDYGDALTWVRAFLGHAIDFESKLRNRFFDKFEPNGDPDWQRCYTPPPKFIGGQLWSNLPLNSGSS